MIRRSWLGLLYYASWAVFGSVALLLNLASLPFLPWHRRQPVSACMRHVIRWLFGQWLRWLHLTGLVRVSWRGFDRPIPSGAVCIANHPSLIDATILLARLPDTVCIFKPSLMRNPAVGPAAVLAGYAGGMPGVDLVRDVAERLIAGQSVLIFPEGTRTETSRILNPLRPGFALIAERARAPVNLFLIHATAELMPKGRPWWHFPAAFPAKVEIVYDRTWEHNPVLPPEALTAEVEQHLLARLTEGLR